MLDVFQLLLQAEMLLFMRLTLQEGTALDYNLEDVAFEMAQVS